MTELTLGPDFGIEHADALRERLAKSVRARKPVTLVIERVDKLHTAALQVLSAFVRDRAAANAATVLAAPEELCAAAALLGVAEVLGLAAAEKTP